MKILLIRALTLTGLMTAIAGGASAQAAPNEPASHAVPAKLENSDILDMVKAGLPEEVILAKVQGSPANFDTSPVALAALKSAQVPSTVILAMVKRANQGCGCEEGRLPLLATEEARRAAGVATQKDPDYSTIAQPGPAPSIQPAKAKPSIDPGAPSHAFDLNILSGWVFNLPGAQAAVFTPSGTAVSPVQNTHVAPSAGATFWITRYLGVYGDFIAVDEGKASASSGGLSASSSGTLTGGFGGVQLQAYKSRFRPYLDIGGGVWHESDQFSTPTGSYSATANAGSLRAGGGLRSMISKRWGVQMSVEVYHFNNSNYGVSRTFPRVSAGWFFQTKPSGE